MQDEELARHAAQSADSRAIVESFLAGNMRVVADDAEIWSNSLTVDDSGQEIISAWGPQEKSGWRKMGRYMVEAATVPYRLTPVAWTVDGERVAVEATGHMVHRNGLEYNNVYHLCYVVREGQIVSMRHYCDTALFDRVFRSHQPVQAP